MDIKKQLVDLNGNTKMKLIELYSLSSSLKIGEIDVFEKFYPLDFQNYFTIQAGSGQTSKNYDYWNNVIELIYPFLKQNNIELLQIGNKEDISLKYCKNLCGQTDINQTFYILNRSLLHIGNDSFAAHVVGSKKLPLVACYGTTTIREHGPYWNNKDHTILIESHRNGNIPSFGMEQFKTINLIKPEEIVSAIFKLLNIDYKSPVDTFFIGNNYNPFIIEWIPNGIIDPKFMSNIPITVRQDLFFNEDNMLVAGINGRKLNIVTNKPIKVEILNKIKSNIVGINYEISYNDDINYIKQLKAVGIQTRMFTKEKDLQKISDLRLKFFDICLIDRMEDKTKQNFIDDAAKYLNKDLDKDQKFPIMKYRSNKFIISDGKIFTSKAAWKANISVKNFEENICDVIDNEDFWCDYQFYYFFNKI